MTATPNTSAAKRLDLQAVCEIQAAAAEGKPAKISILAYSGNPMKVGGWGMILIDLAGVSLPAQLPILVDHVQSIDTIAGHGTATVKSGSLYVDGELHAGGAGPKVRELAKSGMKLQASIGLDPQESTFISAGKKARANGRDHEAPPGGFTLIGKSTLREVSVLPVAADASTSVHVSAKRGNQQMENETPATETATEPTGAEILKLERERVAAVTAVGASPEITARAISEGWTADRCALEKLRAERPRVPAAHVHDAESSLAHGPVLAAAVMVRCGRHNAAEKSFPAPVMEAAWRHRHTSMVDLCRAALAADGKETPITRNELIRAAFSSISLPNALGDAASKILLDAYRETPATWRSFAYIASVPDFRTRNMVRPIDGGNLEPVAPTGELKSGTLTDALTQVQAKTFGKVLKISRQDIVNDDLGLFDLTASTFGQSAARSVSDNVFEVLLANGGNFFHADHNNYTSGAATNLSTLALSAGIAAVTAQVDAEDRNLDIMPATLLVPPELRDTATNLLQSEFLATVADTSRVPTGNPFRNSLSLQVEPRLSNSARFANASALAWYLFGAPATVPVVVAFLNGQQNPTVEFMGLESSVDTLGVAWRVYLDHGAALGDYRAAYLSKGEA